MIKIKLLFNNSYINNKCNNTMKKIYKNKNTMINKIMIKNDN